MSDEKITYDDVKEYESLFTLAPSFILSTMAKRNTNLILKFKSQILSYLKKLNTTQQKKLDLLLKSDIDDLQKVMLVAYKKTRKGQYKVLANPKNKNFIKMNLDELKKII